MSTTPRTLTEAEQRTAARDSGRHPAGNALRRRGASVALAAAILTTTPVAAVVAPAVVAPAAVTAQASPGPAEGPIYCGPGYRAHGAQCKPIRTVGPSPASQNKRSALAWVALGAAAAASLLNPFG
jgi:hypothetical protein